MCPLTRQPVPRRGSESQPKRFITKDVRPPPNSFTYSTKPPITPVTGHSKTNSLKRANPFGKKIFFRQGLRQRYWDEQITTDYFSGFKCYHTSESIKRRDRQRLARHTRESYVEEGKVGMIGIQDKEFGAAMGSWNRPRIMVSSLHNCKKIIFVVISYHVLVICYSSHRKLTPTSNSIFVNCKRILKIHLKTKAA